MVTMIIDHTPYSSDLDANCRSARVFLILSAVSLAAELAYQHSLITLVMVRRCCNIHIS